MSKKPKLTEKKFIELGYDEVGDTLPPLSDDVNPDMSAGI